MGFVKQLVKLHENYMVKRHGNICICAVELLINGPVIKSVQAVIKN